jgi:hypothetical protein
MAIKGLDSPVFEGQAMVRALAQRDIGAVYRLLVDHGVSQRYLAGWSDRASPRCRRLSAAGRCRAMRYSFGLQRVSECRVERWEAAAEIARRFPGRLQEPVTADGSHAAAFSTTIGWLVKGVEEHPARDPVLRWRTGRVAGRIGYTASQTALGSEM